MEYSVEITGVRNLQARLGQLQSSLLDWGDAMASIGEAYKAYYSSVPFASRGSIYGQPWPALNPKYKSWKAKKFPGRPMLVRTGKMMRGFSFLSTRNQVKFFNKVDYFEKHQEGIGVPQRIVMALTQERRDAALDILKGELTKKVGA